MAELPGHDRLSESPRRLLAFAKSRLQARLRSEAGFRISKPYSWLVGWAHACDRSYPPHPRSLLPLVKLSFLELLVEQLRSRGILRRPGDFAIGISTSGNSPNVLHGLSVARKIGLSTVALTGCTGGKLKAAVDYCICAPSNETPRIQECHILIGHIISELVEETMFHEQIRVSRSALSTRKLRPKANT